MGACRSWGSGAWPVLLGLLLLCVGVGGLQGHEEDWYKCLGVARGATKAEIRTAYRKWVLKWHPDKNPGKEEKAQVMTARLNNAYECLSDAVARRDFDEKYPKAGGGGSSGAQTPEPPKPGSAPSGQSPPRPTNTHGSKKSSAGGSAGRRTRTPSPEFKAPPFDPRNPGGFWGAWESAGFAKKAADQAGGFDQTKSFYREAHGRAAGGVENLEAFMRKADAGHRKTAYQFQAREARQRVRADRFQGFRNKQVKRAAHREEVGERHAQKAADAAREDKEAKENARLDRDMEAMIGRMQRRKGQGEDIFEGEENVGRRAADEDSDMEEAHQAQRQKRGYSNKDFEDMKFKGVFHGDRHQPRNRKAPFGQQKTPPFGRTRRRQGGMGDGQFFNHAYSGADATQWC